MSAILPARPEQTSFPASLIHLVNDALRTAATADTYQEALDATGAALAAIAQLARAEVSHG